MIILLRMHTKIMLIEGNKTHLKNHKIHTCMCTHVLYKLYKNCSYMRVYTCIKMKCNFCAGGRRSTLRTARAHGEVPLTISQAR